MPEQIDQAISVFDERMLATISRSGTFPEGISERHISTPVYRKLFSELSSCQAEWGVVDPESVELWLKLGGFDDFGAEQVRSLLTNTATFPETLISHYVAVAKARAEEAVDDEDERFLRQIAALRESGQRVTSDMMMREHQAWNRLHSKGGL